MPFGVKTDSQGNEIDFNRVYTELIKPALRPQGLMSFGQTRRNGSQQRRPVRCNLWLLHTAFSHRIGLDFTTDSFLALRVTVSDAFCRPQGIKMLCSFCRSMA
jgi:hypothetical protein